MYSRWKRGSPVGGWIRRSCGKVGRAVHSLWKPGLLRRRGEMSPHLEGIRLRWEGGIHKWFTENDLWLGDADGEAGRGREIFLEIEAQHLV